MSETLLSNHGTITEANCARTDVCSSLHKPQALGLRGTARNELKHLYGSLGAI